MREDRSLRIPTKNQALLLLTPLVLISLIIAASFWAATLQPASKLNKQFKGVEEKAKVSDDEQVEIVVPHKSWPPPLVEHDLIYDTPSVAAESLRRHHSGHYRRKLADIWDPHPQYEFTAFGKTFHLQLQLNSEFTIPNLQVTKLWHNMSIRENPDLNPNGCFYTGTVLGDPLSSVAVNLCHGITGHIRTSDASYLIEPAEPYKDHDTPIKHSITRISSYKPASTKSTPSSQNDLCHVLENSNRTREVNVEMNRRRKRSLSREYFIELMVVTDKKMVDFHGAGLQHYILTLMAVVTQIFKDASIGHLITVAVVKYYELNESNMDHIFGLPRNKVGPTSSHEMLRKFCNWQRDINFFDDDTHANHHDAAVFLTKENICRAPFTENCDTLGLAEVGTMCDKKSCAIIRDNGLAAAFTIAHELGHLLSMPHDDDLRCSNLNMDVVHKVMSRIMDNNTYPWAWSECSRYFLTEFLDAGYGSCMLDHPLNDLQQEENYILPGEKFTLNKQCQLLYGNRSEYCPRPEPMCKRLWCTPEKKISNVLCVTQHLPMADGTLCGEKHWCQKGECVLKDRNALRRIHGGWGSWGIYTKCSRTCGGGVQQAERLCNNPIPLNGGRYCIGRRIKYRSCNTQECPTDKDFRYEQCAKYHNNNLNIVGVPDDVKWVPKYTGIASEERCKLYCRVQNSRSYYILADKVIDGTLCGPDTFDICVNGVCQQAGCDHKLNSSLQLDYCGKCGGNNSTCRQVNGTYSLSQYGYSTVVRIPAGSSNLDIRQIGDSNKDDNYLALADENDEFILNGDHFVSMFRKLILYGGTTLEYTGSDAIVERINSSRPLNKDLIVKVLSVGNLHQPNIVYDYTIQKSSLSQYSWELSKERSYCDKVCNGTARKEVTCVREADRQKVDLFFCQELEKPVAPPKPCNNHCILMWNETSRSECSSHCGPGTRTLSFQCVQFIRSSSKKVPIDNSSCADLPRPSPTEECTGPCDEARWVFTNWGPCSKTCGEGRQLRNASCVDELQRPRNESDCRQSEKKIERICSLEKCPQWRFGDWSPCSVTCGTGQRRRPYWCHSGNLQVNTIYCNSLPVPVHQEQCVLDPCPQWITHEWSPCSGSCNVGQQTRKIECSVPGKCPTYNMPETFQSCTMESCQNRLENAVPDYRRFTWKPSPWSACSVTCGQGIRWRDVECYDEKMGKNVRDSQECLLYLPPIKKHDICQAPRCPTWETGQWGPCSATCDQGIESREVHCVSHTGSPIDESYCNNRPRPDSERICKVANRCRTPIWKTSLWSQCSDTCGGGYRTRTVTCDSETIHCPQPVPASKESCNTEPCSKGTWVFDKWSQCSKSCGDAGLRFRSVRCKSATGDNLPDEACGGRNAKPPERTECHNNPPCHKPVLYDWQHTRHWSPCSKTCGKGVRQRKVWCAKSSGVRVSDTECAASRKPKSVKECQRAPCPYDWAPRPWSQCSVTCGKGFRTRTVQCYGYKANMQVAVNDSYCKNSVKPPFKQECIMNACPKNYRWVPGPWGQCSERCSRGGFQKRKLFCYLGNTKLKKHTFCFKIQKPRRRQKCNIDKCESCMELQRNSNRRKDGEYKLLVSNKVVSIFCHGMETIRPREYITLHAPRENYAEIYDKRLRHPESCPRNGQRIDYCPECIIDYKPNVGFTYFQKIRINVTTMLVDVRDWTYAVVFKGGRVPFGEAGDCYSKASCPQGQFRINLEKTGFKINRHQQWTSDGEYAHHKIQKYEEGIKVVGICGGYCGICRPHRGLKLDVLPP